MRKLVLVAMVILVAGCVSQNEPEIRYVCPTGEVVSQASLCEAETTTTTLSTTTTLQSSSLTGFESVVPWQWSLKDDSSLTLRMNNEDDLDIRVTKIGVDGNEVGIIATDIIAGGSGEIMVNGIKDNLKADDPYAIRLSIFYEYKASSGILLESSGVIKGSVESKKQGELVEILHVDCVKGTVLVKNIGTETIKPGKVTIDAGTYSKWSSESIEPSDITTIRFDTSFEGLLVEASSGGNKDTLQC